MLSPNNITKIYPFLSDGTSYQMVYIMVPSDYNLTELRLLRDWSELGSILWSSFSRFYWKSYANIGQTLARAGSPL